MLSLWIDLSIRELIEDFKIFKKMGLALRDLGS